MSKICTIVLLIFCSILPLGLQGQSIISIQPQGAFMVSAIDKGIYTLNPSTSTLTNLTTSPLTNNFPNALGLDTTRGIVYYDNSNNASSNKAVYGYNYRTNIHFTLINDFTLAPGSPVLSVAGLGGAAGTSYKGFMYLGAEWVRSLYPAVPTYTDFFGTYYPYTNRVTKVILNTAGDAIIGTSTFKDYYTDHGEINYAENSLTYFFSGFSDCDWGDIVIINDTIFERITKSNNSVTEITTRAYKINTPQTKIYSTVTNYYDGLTQTGEDLLHNLYFVGQPDGDYQRYVLADKQTGNYNISDVNAITLNGNSYFSGIIDASGPLRGEGTIGNTIWYDVNEDGIKQVEEIGIYDVPVEIWEDLDNDGIVNIVTDKLLGTAITDFAGHYEFKNTLPGNYIVRVVMAASVNYPAQNFSADYTSNVLSASTAAPTDAGDEGIAGAIAKTSIKKNFNKVVFNDQSFDFGFKGIAFFLPLKNLSFTANLYNKKVQLQWSFTPTGDEDKYILERSIDGIHFGAIENGLINLTNNQISKTTSDNNLPTTNYIYYRLKIIDKTGNAQLSNIIKVKLNNDNSISIYPNPTSGSIFISLSPLFLNKKLNIKITNSLGQVVKLISIPKASSVMQVDLKELSSGTYQCIITENGNILNTNAIQIK